MVLVGGDDIGKLNEEYMWMAWAHILIECLCRLRDVVLIYG